MDGRAIVNRMATVQYKLFDRLRDRRAYEVARRPPTGRDFSGFATGRQCLLVTYRRSGQPVPSPVNFGLGTGEHAGKLYVRTDGTSAKVKRLRVNARVLVIPCGLRGAPKGPAVAGIARILLGWETAQAEAIIAANWSPGMRVFERGLEQASRRFDIPMCYLEITPDG